MKIWKVDENFWDEKRTRSETRFVNTPNYYIDCAVISPSMNSGKIANARIFVNIFNLDFKIKMILIIYFIKSINYAIKIITNMMLLLKLYYKAHGSLMLTVNYKEPIVWNMKYYN